MIEQDKEALSVLLGKRVMNEALNQVAIDLRKHDMNSVESAALAQAYNNGLLAGLNGLYDLAKIKNKITATTRKLRYGPE